MANNTIQIRRTSVTGRTPNTTAGSIATNSQYIATGELALNITDKKLFSSDGTNPAFEVGSNLATTSVGGGAFTASSTLVAATVNANFDTGTLFVDAVNNRVGVGTASPVQVLEVVTGTTGISSFTDAGGNGRLWLAGNSQGSYIFNRDNSSLLLGTANTARLTIDSVGSITHAAGANANFDAGTLFVDGVNNRVGVGTTGPGVALDVVGSANVTVSVNSASLSVGSSFVANSNRVAISGVPLSANGSNGSATQVLTSNGSTGSPYWATFTASATAGGTNTQVQFNDSTAIGGSAGFTFNKDTNNVTIANALTVSSGLTIPVTIRNGTVNAGPNAYISGLGQGTVFVGNSISNATLSGDITTGLSLTNSTYGSIFTISGLSNYNNFDTLNFEEINFGYNSLSILTANSTSVGSIKGFDANSSQISLSSGGTTSVNASPYFITNASGLYLGNSTINSVSNSSGFVISNGTNTFSYSSSTGTLTLGAQDTDISFKAITNVPATPASNTLLIYARNNGGRMLLEQKGPSGIDIPYQPLVGMSKVGVFNPHGSLAAASTFTNGPLSLGFANSVASVSRTSASTNILTRSRRAGWVSAATAGALATIRSGTAAGTGIAQWTTGDGAGLGGFYLVMRFATSDAAAVSGARAFFGMNSSIAVPTNVEPSTLTNSIGVAQLSTDATQWYFTYGGSAAQTAVALGTGLGAPTLNTTIFELILFCPPNQNGVVSYRLTNLGTGATVQNTITPGTPGTQTPLNTTFLAIHAWRTNNATASAVAFDIIGVYIESDT